MGTLKEGGKNIAFIGQLLKPLIDLGPELTRIGELEDYEAKLKLSVENSKKLLADADIKIAAARQKLDDDKAAFEKDVISKKADIKNLTQTADNYVKTKKNDAEAIIIAAKTTADDIAKKAEVSAQAIIDGATNSIKKFDNAIKTKAKTIVDLDDEIKTKEAALADINAKLDKLRA